MSFYRNVLIAIFLASGFGVTNLSFSAEQIPALASTPSSTLPSDPSAPVVQVSSPTSGQTGGESRHLMKTSGLDVQESPLSSQSPRVGKTGGTDEGTEILTLADSIRTHASFDFSGALLLSASPQFQVAWKNSITPFFEGEDDQWQDFFTYAIIFGGRINDQRNIVIYYNPWSDVGLIVGFDMVHRQMTEFFVLTGESIRNQPTNSNPPSWQKESQMLPYGIGRVYAQTEDALNRLYPLRAPYELLPPSLSSHLRTQGEELTFVKARMNNRSNMLQTMAQPPSGSAVAQAQIRLAVLASALKTGDRKKFASVVGENQDKRMTDLVFALPAMNRERLTPAFFLTRDDDMYAALINPSWPIWFVQVRFAKVDRSVRIDTVQVFNFNVVKEILNKTKESQPAK